ncbi:MAG: alpha/beta hydrolase [Proteobacteria bacterium]|nr:alpha/beta hydrolase [Pseudomonadota bacterium]
MTESETGAETTTAAASVRRLSFEMGKGVVAGIALGMDSVNPDIVFSHATGFNAYTYRSLLAPLGERRQVWALDARGHGLTTLPSGTWGYTSWRRHRDDLIAVLEKHTTQPVTLAGHSMGATVSLLVAAKRPDLVASLALIEPVILPAAAYALMELPFGPRLQRMTNPLARSAANRRAHFEDRTYAARAFTGRGVFKTFPPKVIADYLTDGLKEDRRGGLQLSCAPKFEAATFCAQRHDPWTALRAVTCPLVVLRAESGSTVSPAALHKIAALKPGARVATVEGAGHMLPMERPDRFRAAIESAVLMTRGARKFGGDLE